MKAAIPQQKTRRMVPKPVSKALCFNEWMILVLLYYNWPTIQDTMLMNRNSQL